MVRNQDGKGPDGKGCARGVICVAWEWDALASKALLIVGGARSASTQPEAATRLLLLLLLPLPLPLLLTPTAQ